MAALEGRSEVAAVLVENGAPAEAQMYAGPFRPLHLAAQGGRFNRIRFWLQFRFEKQIGIPF